MKLVEQGEYNEARSVLAKRNPKSFETAFLEGLIAKRQNQLSLAEQKFRLSLSLNPDFVLAKRELAHTLLLLGNDEGAKFHFESLAATTPSEIERNSYNRFLEAIQSRRPYGISGYVGLLPSTNANKGSGKTVFVTEFGEFKIDESSRQSSGIGLSAGMSAYYKKQLNSKFNLLASGSIDSILYENSALNSTNTYTNLEIGRQLKRGSYYLGLTLRNTASQWDFTSYKYGPVFRGTYQIDQRRLLSFTGSALKQNYKDTNTRDGYEYFAAAKIRTHLNKTDSYSFGAHYKRELTEKENLSHTDFGVEASYNKQWVGGLTTDFRARFVDKKYDSNFTGLAIARQDQITALSVSLLHSALSFKGFAPQLSYTYTRQKSNISFYDYDSHDVGLIFTKKY